MTLSRRRLLRLAGLLPLGPLAGSAAVTRTGQPAADPLDPRAYIMNLRKCTPILVVDDVEPCLPFWRDHLGFEVTATVPHGESVGFAMLERGGVELMYQSRASVEDDIAAVADVVAGQTTTLFVEVDDLDDLLEALEGAGAPTVVPRRQTFYGMDEIFVQAPCGTVVGFAARLDD